ncbi:rpoB [Lepeophtheirus salmonis]|uniref:RpoB n=1 Tax=Lepeophtheirus salmonis TaxID=72036 RepID=A0A7R8H0P0_LEPSM|nr:rpoB [Lepeophtheirus salmonis]CAF2774199.1 rpoB [Lepeophtheirus salmonis]
MRERRLKGMQSLNRSSSSPTTSNGETECNSELDLRKFGSSSSNQLNFTRQSSISDSIDHFSILFSIPQLLVCSNLQDMMGGSKNSSRPYIQPKRIHGQYTLGLNQLPLPDQDIGNAILHAEKDQIILSFTLQARDLRAAYSWKKQRLKGKVVAILNRTILNVQIKQCFSSTKSPKIHLFQVQEVDGIQVTICGLGPLNWIIKKALRSLLRRHVRSWIENDLKEVLQRELYNVSIGDELSCALFYNNESLYHPNKKVV